MPNREQTITDHQERLNRVLDYIRRHLDETLNLTHLAEVACFSPFHFHRVFAAHVGETVSAHVRRLRLELAAHRLCHTERSVTDIALSAGYETPSAFNKAFARHFDMAPTRFKKKRKVVFFSQPIELALQPTEEEIAMNAEIRERTDTKVVYVRRTGDYNKSAEQAWQAVCRFAGPKGLMGPHTTFIGISHDDPGITPSDKLRYDACLTVDREVQPEGEVGVQTIAGGRYAVFMHEGPYSELAQTYGQIYRAWLPQSGEKLRDVSCFEIYLNSPDQVKPADLRTEIWIGIE